LEEPDSNNEATLADKPASPEGQPTDSAEDEEADEPLEKVTVVSPSPSAEKG
jgi:hypothetical protein